MCIRSVAVDDGSGPVIQTAMDNVEWGHRGQLLLVFNPKGGVGKTTVATNLAAALVTRGQRVLLIDADTVTGHVSTSLGMEAVPTVIDAWRDEIDGGPMLTFSEQASVHSSGLRVLPLSSHPLNTELLEPQRVAGAIAVARRNFDYVIVDLHPSYSPLNRAIFDRADRILVPVTPDLPAIRAVVKLREIADELGMRDRLSLVVNRANSGIKLEDIERAVGIPTLLADPVRRPAAGQGQQRGPHAVRDRAHARRSRRTSPSSRTGCSASSTSRSRSSRSTCSAARSPPGPDARRASARGRAPPRPSSPDQRWAAASVRAVLPADAAQRGARELRVRLAGSLVHLLHAAQVEAVDEDHVDLGVGDLDVAERARPRRRSA